MFRVYQADIKTVDGFCASLLRKHIHLLEPVDGRCLTPDFRVLDEAEAQLLRERALERTMETFYQDIENGDEYWISGLKKGESNRHWAGHGKIKIDRRVVAEYLVLIGEKELPQNLFEVVEIEDRFPVERIHRLLNEREEDETN